MAMGGSARESGKVAAWAELGRASVSDGAEPGAWAPNKVRYGREDQLI